MRFCSISYSYLLPKNMEDPEIQRLEAELKEELELNTYLEQLVQNAKKRRETPPNRESLPPLKPNQPPLGYQRKVKSLEYYQARAREIDPRKEYARLERGLWHGRRNYKVKGTPMQRLEHFFKRMQDDTNLARERRDKKLAQFGLTKHDLKEGMVSIRVESLLDTESEDVFGCLFEPDPDPSRWLKYAIPTPKEDLLDTSETYTTDSSLVDTLSIEVLSVEHLWSDWSSSWGSGWVLEEEEPYLGAWRWWNQWYVNWLQEREDYIEQKKSKKSVLFDGDTYGLERLFSEIPYLLRRRVVTLDEDEKGEDLIQTSLRMSSGSFGGDDIDDVQVADGEPADDESLVYLDEQVLELDTVEGMNTLEQCEFAEALAEMGVDFRLTQEELDALFKQLEEERLMEEAKKSQGKEGEGNSIKNCVNYLEKQVKLILKKISNNQPKAQSA